VLDYRLQEHSGRSRYWRGRQITSMPQYSTSTTHVGHEISVTALQTTWQGFMSNSGNTKGNDARFECRGWNIFTGTVGRPSLFSAADSFSLSEDCADQR
jgi:hypothetical protein